MKNKNILITLLAVIIIAAGAYFLNAKNTSNVTTTTNKTVNVGAILSLSSIGASNGESIKNGLELAKKDLLKENINVNIEYYDDATDPKKVVAGVQYMKSKNIEVVFGPIWSYLGDAALGVVGDSNITLLAPSMTSEVVQKTSPRILFGQVKNVTKLPSTILWMQENNIKKPAIIVNQVSWGIVHANIFAEATKSVNGVIVLNEQVGFGKEKETIPALILKAKSLGADAVLWSGSNDGEVIITSEMQKNGMKVPFFADEEVMTAIDSKLISKDISIPVYTWKKSINPEFIEKYKSAYGSVPSSYADAAYDMLIATAKTINKNGTANLKANLNILNHQGYANTYQFDVNGDIGGGEWSVVNVIKGK